MKAIVVSEFGDTSVLRFQDAPTPEPGEGEVRVRIRAAGVNPVETYIRAGQYGVLPKLPFTPGNDGAGVVDKVGPGVTRLTVGQRVVVAAILAKRNTGTYAEYTVCDADAVYPLSDAASFEEGAGLGTPGLAAAYALFAKARIEPGETVLIHGATGGVGSLAVQMARQNGAVVFGTADDKEGEALLKEIGAEKTFIHGEEGYLERIAEAAPGGLDVVIEMLANVNLSKDLALLAKHGRIVVVGNRGSLDFSPRDMMMKTATVYGILLNNMFPKDFKVAMCRLKSAQDNGMHVIVGQALPLEKAPQAHTDVIEGRRVGKIVLTVGDF